MLGQFRNDITALDLHMQQGESRGGKDMIYKSIPFLSILSLMALVIQFDTHKRPHGDGVAQ